MSVRTSLVLRVGCNDLTNSLEQSLFVARAGTCQVKTEAPAESPGWSRVELSPSLHLIELEDHVPGVQDAVVGWLGSAGCDWSILVT